MGNDWSRNLQPAQGTTAIASLSAVSAIALLYPDTFAKPHLVSFVHVISISTWFGAHFWVTFIAGLTKMKLLPRHLFGLVQSKLFPKCFFMGICLTTVALVTFTLQNPYATWQGDAKFQALALMTNLGTTLLNYFYVEPKMTEYMIKEHKYEREHGHGDEIGPITDPEILQNEQYKQMRKSFFIYHGVSTTLNMVGIAATGVYLWFLSRKLQL